LWDFPIFFGFALLEDGIEMEEGGLVGVWTGRKREV
jgi:hypothetical protein